MNKVTQKIMESVKNIIPNDQVSALEGTVNEFVKDTTKQIREEYEKTLEQSFVEWDQQLKETTKQYEDKIQESEKIAYEGYAEAEEMLGEKDQAIQKQTDEFESFLEEQYSVAEKMITEEKSKNDEIEQTLYESYNQQVEDIKEDLINKIDGFLQKQVEEIAEAVRKELKNSPEILESKVQFDKIKDIILSSTSTEDISRSAESKIDEMSRIINQLQGELKATKARNLRLETENKSFGKTIKENNDYVSDPKTLEDIKRETERKISERLAQKAEGRGNVVNREDLITEQIADKPKPKKSDINLGYSQEDLSKVVGFQTQK